MTDIRSSDQDRQHVETDADGKESAEDSAQFVGAPSAEMQHSKQPGADLMAASNDVSPSAAAWQELSLDLTQFNEALQGEMKLATGSSAPTAYAEKHLNEIVEDMLFLMEQTKGLQESMQAVTGRLDSLEQALHGISQTHGRGLKAIQNDLLWARRAQAATFVFDQISDPLEQMRIMRHGLNSRRDKKTMAQLDAIINILDRTIRLLGFQQFDANVNEAFDPERMVCRGYMQGKPGVVLKALKAGYRADRFIVRPAEVMIADPSLGAQGNEDGVNDS